MQVILRADVENLGRLGDVVTVRPGYGRNYLLPQGMAMAATKANLKVFELERKKLQAEMDALRSAASDLGERIKKADITIAMHVGENDKLYGSVTSAVIADALEAQGIEIDRRRVIIDAPIRTVGQFPVRIRLHADVLAELTVNVVPEERHIEDEPAAASASEAKDPVAPDASREAASEDAAEMDAPAPMTSLRNDDDFYLPAHRDIFASFLDLTGAAAPVDLATVATHPKSQSKLEGAGGAAYLAELMNSAISTANVEYFATMVREKSLARSLIPSCSDIIGRCFDPALAVNELLDESEQAVFAISNRTAGKTVRSAKELATKVFKDLADRMDRNEMVTGVPTKYTHLDMMTAGLQPSDLIIVAARPAMAKRPSC